MQRIAPNSLFLTPTCRPVPVCAGRFFRSLIAMPAKRVLSLLTLSLCAATVWAAGLNDTGITFCSDATSNNVDCATASVNGFPRQDGHFVKPVSFTKIANNGSELPARAKQGEEAADWACTKDKNTGLIWEIKTTTYPPGLRHSGHKYAWYNSYPKSNGGYVETSSKDTCFSAGRCDTEKYVQDINTSGLCGARDWRMPKIKELESIQFYDKRGTDYGRYFPDGMDNDIWSSSPAAKGDALNPQAWCISLGLPQLCLVKGPNTKGVRLVRGGG